MIHCLPNASIPALMNPTARTMVTAAVAGLISGLTVYFLMRPELDHLRDETAALREIALSGKIPVRAVAASGNHESAAATGNSGAARTARNSGNRRSGPLSGKSGDPAGSRSVQESPDAETVGDSFVETDLVSGIPGLQSAAPTVSGNVYWDHSQATGAPDTPDAGDRPTAWAPLSPGSGMQWLQLQYGKAVELKEVNIHETYNPGAIAKVAAIMPDGSERVIWQGNAAKTAAGASSLETSVPVPPGITADKVKVYVDTDRVGSWPEIDAVELVGRNGSRQWATGSSASSSYSSLYDRSGNGGGTLHWDTSITRLLR